MHFLCSLAVAAALFGAAFSRRSSHVRHETRVESPTWTKHERVHPDQILPIRIGLKQENLDSGEALLLSVSDPESPKYGKFYTSDEVIKLFSPSDETITKVRQWLVSEGIHKDRIAHSENRGWLAFDGTTSEAEKLLHAQFYNFEHVNRHKHIACDGYSVPSHVSGHIDYITPGVRLLTPKTTFSGLSSASSLETYEDNKQPQKPKFARNFPRCTRGRDCCDQLTLPECVRALYKLPPLHEQLQSKPNPNNSLGIHEWVENFRQTDLDNFYVRFAPWIPNGTHPKIDSIDGGRAHTRRSQYSGEAMLDYSVAFPLIYPQKIADFQTDDVRAEFHPVHRGSPSLFQDFLDAIDGSYCTYKAYGEKGNDPKIDNTYPQPGKGGYKGKLQCGVFKPTNVISTSYLEEEYNLPAFYQKRQCNEFMKLGLQGVSILVASGDYGAAGNVPPIASSMVCKGLKGRKIFSPTYPSNCPYVTSVGATMIKHGNSVADPEVAALALWGKLVNFTSGGGFSNLYSAPQYQGKVLSTYFGKHKPDHKSYNGSKNLGKDGGVFNRLGRGFPDISANGLRIPVIYENRFDQSGGTSASAPMFASIINRIVENRLKMGKTSLGFLNPALYGNPGVLNDITKGNNQGCRTGGSRGFDAVKGWDPVTGLGTPNYPKMEEYFLSLP